MYLELQDKIEILENSYAKVWEKLELEDQRFDRLETSVQGLDIKLDEKVEMIQDWFVHISTHTLFTSHSPSRSAWDIYLLWNEPMKILLPAGGRWGKLFRLHPHSLFCLKFYIHPFLFLPQSLSLSLTLSHTHTRTLTVSL